MAVADVSPRPGSSGRAVGTWSPALICLARGGRARLHGRARFLGFAAALFAAMLVACSKPKLGGGCSGSRSVCVDPKSGLYCGPDGFFKAMACGGPRGCTVQGDEAACDSSLATAGDGCERPNAGACSPDHKSLLQCKDGTFVLIDTCNGPDACKSDGAVPACDNEIAGVGDVCSNEGNFACTIDRAMALRCEGGRYAQAQSCRGPRACAIVHPKGPKLSDIACDFSVASENDPCIEVGNEACSPDRSRMLTCKGGKYTDPTPCPGPSACMSTRKGTVSCDTAAPTPPDPAPTPRGGRRHHPHG